VGIMRGHFVLVRQGTTLPPRLRRVDVVQAYHPCRHIDHPALAYRSMDH
jgi:hypothetical protein